MPRASVPENRQPEMFVPNRNFPYLSGIRWATLDFSIRARTRLELPPYKGSTFRGGIGAALGQMCCPFWGDKVKKPHICKKCPKKKTCIYLFLFETPRPPDSLVLKGSEKKNEVEEMPHPFILEPPLEERTSYLPGETLTFSIVLVGSGAKYWNSIVQAVKKLGQIGLGKNCSRGLGRFDLISVVSQGQKIYDDNVRVSNSFAPENCMSSIPTDIDSKPIYRLVLELLTPIRLQYQGRLGIHAEFSIMVTNLQRRLSSLGDLYCGLGCWGSATDGPDRKKILAEAKEVKIEKAALSWVDYERYSQRQEKRLKLGGFKGRITYRGNLTPFCPLLKAGEHLHVGRMTSFGLGKYAIIGEVD